MKFLTNIDLTTNQLLNAKLQQLGSDITASGNEGIIFYNSVGHLAKISNGTTIDVITNILEGVTGSGAITAGAISGKSQAISIAASSGSVPGTMAAADYTTLHAATNLNTASTIVLRDASGNFTATTITAALTGTASNATQLNGQAASYYNAAANLTGTLTHTFISDFDTEVRTSTLNQMTAPTADLSINSHKLTNVVDPTASSDAATKNYVDNIASGLDPKGSVRAASTATVTVTYNSTGGTATRGQLTAMPNTIDGVTLAATNRVLLKDQSTGAQNGIWVVTTLGTGANGVWDRATDFDQDAEVTAGAFTFVEEGTVNGDTGWVLTTNNPIIIGGASGTALAYAQFSSSATITASNGILKTGSNLTAVPDTTSVNANSLSVSSTGLTIATGYVGQTSITTLGTIATGTWSGSTIAVAKGGTAGTTIATARTGLGYAYNSGQGGTSVTTSGTAGYYALTGSSTTYVVTHSIGTQAVIVQCFEVSTFNVVYPDIQYTSTTTCTITFASAPTSGQYACVIIG